MLRNIAHYFFALVILSSSALMYDAYAKRWLMPKFVEPVDVKPRDIVVEDTNGDLFPDGAWQRGTCKRLQTSDGELLFQNWEPTSDNQWKLWPITLIVGRGMSDQSNPEPIILEAAAGAEIRFAGSLDMMSGGDAPPIERGRMMGLVEIRRPTVDPTKSPLLIRASNVGIDNRKVWTTEPILLQMGQTRMVGRDLTLHLAASAGSDQGGGGAAAILDRMELIYLDELVIPLETNALAKTQQKRFGSAFKSKEPQGIAASNDAGQLGVGPSNLSSQIPGQTPGAFLKVNCEGRVEYDFALDQLSLRDNVVLQHHVPGVADDQFNADSLELRFRDPQNRGIERVSPLDWLNFIDAQGSPAVIDLPSLDSRIVADRIELDAIGGLLKASGEDGIEVRRGVVSAKLSQLAYQYDPADPQAIGTINILGGGLVSLLDPEMPIREFIWDDSFKLEPVGTPESGDSLNDIAVRVSGNVQARFSDGGDFRADSIDGILRAVNEGKSTELVNGVVQPKPRKTLCPDRFQAFGDVHLDNNAVAADTPRLVIYFVDEAEPAAQMIGGTGSESSDSSSNGSPSTLRQWVTQPSGDSQPTAPVARSKPRISGDEIAAKLRMNEDGISVKDLSVKGNVKLVHAIDAGGQTLPAELTGNELILTSEAGTDVLQLSSRPGSPSRFDLGDGFFVGPQINIWPSDNIVRIEGAGEFQMPTAVLPQSLTGDGQSRFEWTKAPHCKWNGEMIFDGKTVVMTDGVDITAELENQNEPWSIHMIGDRLELVFLDSVDLQQVQSMQGAAIQQVTLFQSETQPVLIQAEQFAADGVREARHVMQAPRLTLLPSGGGKLIGAGPGWVRSWLYADTSGPLAPPDDSASDQIKSTSERSLMGLHLVYHQALRGDLATKSLAFLRGVRVGVKPVVDWQDTFDANEMDSISNGESTIDCDTLQITVAPSVGNRPNLPGMTTPWELQARDGVKFRSRSDQGLVEGTADNAVYASQKDLFTIEGTPSRGARISKTHANGEAGPVLNMRKMSIRPKTLEFDMTMDSVISGQIPSTQNR